MHINEIFYSIEGEGHRIGQPTIFVRVQGCPWRCPYCDTPQAQESGFGLVMTPEEVVGKVSEITEITGCHTIEFTGGSPEIQLQEIRAVMNRLVSRFTGPLKFVFQVSGAFDITYLRDDFTSDICFCYDHKSEETGVPFNVDVKKLTRLDEIKFVLTPDNVESESTNIKNILKMNSLVNIIVTTESVQGEPEKWKEMTETLLRGHIPQNCDQIHILPRLQQLYWPYEPSR